MKPQFNIEKTTQIASLFLQMLGGQDYYIMLVKLMYLTDREALLRWGRTLTFDNYVSMKNGCVPSGTLDLIKRQRDSHYWAKFISEPHYKKISLLTEPETKELSKMELDLIAEIFAQFGDWDRFDLAAYTHDLPEYTETKSSIPIAYQEILKAGEKDGEDIAKTMRELEGVALLEQFT